MTVVDVHEIAERGEGHAYAVSVVLQLQAGLERQRRILHLRAELERLTDVTASVRKELKQAEAEHQLERRMTEELISRFDHVTV